MHSVSESKPRDRRALNAYRHGLTGRIHILTPADRAAYESHCRSIHRSFSPVGGMELELVQAICDDRWRLKRAAAIEEAIFAMGLAEPDTHTAGHDEIDEAFAHARVWLSEGKNLQLLTLYESRIQRKLEKNIALLRQLQQDRKSAQPSERKALEAAGESQVPAAGFVFSAAAPESVEPAAPTRQPAPEPAGGRAA